MIDSLSNYLKEPMKVVEESTWSWVLLENSGNRYLSVVAGGLGLYQVDFQLNEIETNEFVNRGRPYLEELAETVRQNIGSFQMRAIADFSSRPDVKNAVATWREARTIPGRH